MGQPSRRVLVWTVVTTALFLGVFFALTAALPAALPNREPDLATYHRALQWNLILTTETMFVAGVLGGCLYNFRGLIKHSRDGTYNAAYELSYYLQPFAGGISGLIVFFLLVGGLLALNVDDTTGNYAWTTLIGRMPFIAFSLLAGFGANEFMLKLKDLSDTLFALSGQEQRDDRTHARADEPLSLRESPTRGEVATQEREKD